MVDSDNIVDKIIRWSKTRLQVIGLLHDLYIIANRELFDADYTV